MITIPARARLAAFALGAVATSMLAGCGSSAPSCDKAIARAAELRNLDDADRAIALRRCSAENWSAGRRSCIAGAKSEAALEACAEKREGRPRSGGGGFDGYMERSRRTEAELNLKAIEKAIKASFYENAAFPEGTAPLTPSAPCCEGPNHKCAPDPSLWTGSEVWNQLDFEVTEPAYFQYRYDGSSKEAVAEATGDLDCDGIPVTFTLRCQAPDGNPSCELAKPSHPD